MTPVVWLKCEFEEPYRKVKEMYQDDIFKDDSP